MPSGATCHVTTTAQRLEPPWTHPPTRLPVADLVSSTTAYPVCANSGQSDLYQVWGRSVAIRRAARALPAARLYCDQRPPRHEHRRDARAALRLRRTARESQVLPDTPSLWRGACPPRARRNCRRLSPRLLPLSRAASPPRLEGRGSAAEGAAREQRCQHTDRLGQIRLRLPAEACRSRCCTFGTSDLHVIEYVE